METRHRIYKLLSGLIRASIVIGAASCGFQGQTFPEERRTDPSREVFPGAAPAELAPSIQAESWPDGICDNTLFRPVYDFNIHPVPSLDEPAPREPFIDPVFGTCVVRVTDRSSDITSGDPSRGMKNEYSRVQSFNANGSRLIALTTEGNWYLYNAFSLQPMGQMPIGHAPRWDAEDPDLLYFTEETRLMSYRISTEQRQIIHEFADDFPGHDLAAVWTRFEGSPSFDGRYWGLMAEDQDWMTVALLIYDLETDQVIAKRETPPSDIDSVTISPLSGYFLAYYDNSCEPGLLGSDESPCGLMLYDRTLENGRGLLRIVGHSDPGLDVHKKEVLVYQDIDTDNVSMLDLGSGEITPLWPIDFRHSSLGFHFSGRALRRPGWILVSTTNGAQPSSTWMDDQIIAAELKRDGRIVRLAHTRSTFDEHIEHDYWAEPHGSVNQDFTKIVFTSNWGRAGTDEVEMYMINLPDNWLSQIP